MKLAVTRRQFDILLDALHLAIAADNGTDDRFYASRCRRTRTLLDFLMEQAANQEKKNG